MSTTGWLPPLLSRIQEDKTNVLVPVIDVIDDDTFGFMASPDTPITRVNVGGFNWGLLFNWHAIPPQELQRIHYQSHLPVRYVSVPTQRIEDKSGSCSNLVQLILTVLYIIMLGGST